MKWFFETLWLAFIELLHFDGGIYQIVGLTLIVSLSALLIASVIALPFVAWLALFDGCGRRLTVVILNTLMGLPPILSGLLVYLLLANRGPLGQWELLFTPTAMIIAQLLLIFPIICSLSYHALRQKQCYFADFFISIQLSRFNQMQTCLFEARQAIIIAMVTGLGRALGEVGAVMIVGGNILHHTRTMTTAIALETSRGDLVTAMGLGILLLLLSLLLNSFLWLLHSRWKVRSGR